VYQSVVDGSLLSESSGRELLLLRDHWRRWECVVVFMLRLRGDCVREGFRGEGESRCRKRGSEKAEDVVEGLGVLRLNEMLVSL
jgi:hypothetical protein